MSHLQIRRLNIFLKNYALILEKYPKKNGVINENFYNFIELYLNKYFWKMAINPYSLSYVGKPCRG